MPGIIRPMFDRIISRLLPLALMLAFAAAAVAAPGDGMILSLDDAISLALQNDENLKQAAAAVDGAEADVMNAGSGRLPQLSISGEYATNLKKGVMFLPPDLAAGFGGQSKIEMGRDYTFQGAATLTFNLWTSGRLSAATGAAREMLASSRYRQDLIADGVRYQATAAYMSALLAADNVRIAEKALDETREALRVARAAYEQGSSSRFDLLRSEVEVANREAPLVRVRNQFEQSLLSLGRVCGVAPGAAVSLSDTLSAVAAPDDLENLLERMRGSSPEIKAMQRQVGAARQVVSLAKAGRGPSLQLIGNYNIQAQWDDDLAPDSNERAPSATAALAFRMPIFDGLQAKSEINSAAADLRIAEIELDRVTRDRDLAVRRSRLDVENARAILEGRRESVKLAEEAHRLALVRLRNGLATPLERLDAELALTESRVQLSRSLYDCNIARAALDLAVGSRMNHTAADGAMEVSE